jgi:hypothetical protein
MPSKYKRENGPKAGRHESDPTNCGWDSILRREHLLSQPAIRMLDIPQTKVWGVLIGDTEEGTHYVCFTTCGKNRVGNRFHARVMMSVKREHTHLRCQFDLRAVERPLSFFSQDGITFGDRSRCSRARAGIWHAPSQKPQDRRSTDSSTEPSCKGARAC